MPKLILDEPIVTNKPKLILDEPIAKPTTMDFSKLPGAELKSPEQLSAFQPETIMKEPGVEEAATTGEVIGGIAVGGALPFVAKPIGKIISKVIGKVSNPIGKILSTLMKEGIQSKPVTESERIAQNIFKEATKLKPVDYTEATIEEAANYLSNIIPETPTGIISKTAQEIPTGKIIPATTITGEKIVSPKAPKILTALEERLAGISTTTTESDIRKRLLSKTTEKLVSPEVATLTDKTINVSPLANASIDEKYAFNINKNRLYLTPEGRKTLDASVTKNIIKLTNGKKVLTNDEVRELAKELGKSDLDLTLTPASEYKKAIANDKAVRDRLVTLSNRAIYMTSKAEKEGVEKEFLELLQVNSNYGDIAGKVLQARNIKAGGKLEELHVEVMKSITKVNQNNDLIAKEAANVDWNDMRSVNTFIRKFVVPKLSEKIDEMRYINLLSSPKTHIVNTSTNIIQTFLPIAEKTINAASDMAWNGLRGKERTHFFKEVPLYIKGSFNSGTIGEAFGNALKSWRGITAPTNLDVASILGSQPKLGGKLGELYRKPIRALEAADQFFRTIIQGGEQEGIAFVNQLKGLGKTTQQITDEASARAYYRVFRQGLFSKEQGSLFNLMDKYTNAMLNLRDTPGIKYIIPFVSTPTNILKQGIEYSPFGLATMVNISLKDKVFKKVFHIPIPTKWPLRISRIENNIGQFSKALIGSSVLLGAGMLANAGKTTWDTPKDPTLRKEWDASNMQPYSVKLGDKWYSYQKLGPLAYPIAMAAGFKSAMEEHGSNQNTIDTMVKILGTTGMFFAGQSYMQGIGDLFAAIRGDENKTTKIATSLPLQLFPYRSFIGWVQRLTDGINRRPQGVAETFASGMPFLSKLVTPYGTPAGEPSRRQFNIFNQFSPVTVTKVSPQDELRYEMLKKAQLRRAEFKGKREEFENQLLLNKANQ